MEDMGNYGYTLFRTIPIYSIEYHNKKRGYTHIDFVYPLIFQGYEQSIKLFIARVIFT